MQEMSALAASLKEGQPAFSSGPSSLGTAPAIAGTTLNTSPEDMAAALQVLQSKTLDAQLKAAKEGVEISRKKLADQNERAANKIQDWIKACHDAESKAKAGGILGWITKIGSLVASAFGVVAAAALTVGTGGLTAPLMVMSCAALVGAGMSTASAISQEAGGPALDVNSVISRMANAILKKAGVPEDKLSSATKVMSGAIAVMAPGYMMADPTLAANLGSGITELAGGNAIQAGAVGATFTMLATIAISVAMVVASAGMAEAAAVDGVAYAVQATAGIGEAVSGAVVGAVGAASGGVAVAKATDEQTASMAQADRKTIAAVIAKVQKQMEDDRESVKAVIQQITDAMTLVSQMLNAASDNRSQIASNLSGSTLAV
jgi:hypothetical protein